MKLTYRPEIDGLRAIAVSAVILYHGQEYSQPLSRLLFGDKFGGGFIGVDIFFVISGYLITSIIFKELKECKNTIDRKYENERKQSGGKHHTTKTDKRLSLITT